MTRTRAGKVLKRICATWAEAMAMGDPLAYGAYVQALAECEHAEAPALSRISAGREPAPAAIQAPMPPAGELAGAR